MPAGAFGAVRPVGAIPPTATAAGPSSRSEGAEKGIYFYILENRLFEEFFKFLQACSNFRFSRGYYQNNGAYRPYFPFLLSSIRFILTRFDANIATALCIVNALRP